jgi:hypothetical protein
MGVFEETKYFLAKSLPPHCQEQLEYALSKNGATKATSIATATHVIADSPYFEGFESLPEEGVVVVSVGGLFPVASIY